MQQPPEINKQQPADNSKAKPRNIFETVVWKKSINAVTGLWANYRGLLKNSFEQMPRAMQEQLISRVCLIVTIGVTTVLLMFVYTFIPQLLREILVPLVLVGSFWLGKNVVTAVVLSRYEHMLNRKF
jgi:hypothetical protein